ncbi:MAG: ABC transporter permease [Candidatus Eiseniibacteriota bacterium]
MKRILAIVRKETHQILRDPLSLGILLGVPTMMLLLYGFALNWDVRHVRTIVVDRDRTAESRAFVRAFTGSGYFDVVQWLDDDAGIEHAFDRGEARLALVLPAGFGGALGAGREARVQALLDGADANTATTILNYVNALAADYDGRLHVEAAAARGIDPPGIAVATRVWFNPALSSTYFLLPGLIAFIMMITAVISTALSVVREKERGTLEQLRLTPLATTEILIGKTVPYLVVSLLAMTIVLIAARVLFGLVIQGSLVQLYAVSLLFLAGALGFGLLISTLVHRQQDAFQLAGLTSMLPTVLLSGFIFPIRSMPLPLQLLSHVVPARYFIRILRGVILKGAPATAFPWDLLALVVFATLMIGFASLRLAGRKT